MQIDKTTSDIASPSVPGAAQEWRQGLTRWGNAALAALFPFLLTRVFLLLLTYMTVVSTNTSAASDFTLELNTLFYNWFRWDAARYLQIATTGYALPEQTAYFPLYPALVQVVQRILRLDILLTGMLLSNLAFFMALVVFYRFVSMEFDAAIARRSLLYLAIFPTAFCFFAAYGEPVFLLCALLCFYLLRRGYWWLAGLFGGLAALCNFAGCLLFLVFLSEFGRQHLAFIRTLSGEKRKQIIVLLLSLLAAFLIPLGTGIYAYALSRQAGNAFLFLQYADGSSRFNAPWGAPWMAFQHIISGSFLTFADLHSFFSLFLLLFLIVLLVLSCVGPERLAKSQWTLVLFMGLMIGYACCFPAMPGATYNTLDPFPSIQLLAPLTFPAIIMLARLGRQAWFHQIYLLSSVVLWGFLVMQLLTNYWSL